MPRYWSPGPRPGSAGPPPCGSTRRLAGLRRGAQARRTPRALRAGRPPTRLAPADPRRHRRRSRSPPPRSGSSARARAASTASSTTPASPSRGRWRRCRSRTSAARSRSTSIAYVAVTQALLPRSAAPAAGSSSSARSAAAIAFPLTGAYHAAKFGTEAVGDVFRQELRPWGIGVSIIEPGSIDTPIWERGEANADRDRCAGSPQTSSSTAPRSRNSARWSSDDRRPRDPAGEVAKAIVHALESKRPRTRYLVGLDAKVQARLEAVDPDPAARPHRREPARLLAPSHRRRSAPHYTAGTD